LGDRDETETVEVYGNNLGEMLREKVDNRKGRAATGMLFKLTRPAPATGTAIERSESCSTDHYLVHCWIAVPREDEENIL
jgi:hypothetical protein